MVENTSRVELVLFVGPPFAGKTLYYLHNLRATHQRVCPQEVYADRSNKVANLAQLIVHVVGILRRGQSVVIDDINWSASLRTSYFTKVKSKVTGCLCRCLVFRPRFSTKQCQWSSHWDLAFGFREEPGLRHHDVTPELVDVYLDLWFDDEKGRVSRRHALRQTVIAPPDVPVGNGCDDVAVSTVTTLLTCESRFEWNTPALFIQHSAVALRGADADASDKDKPCLNDDIITACRHWAAKHPLGRVIILADDLRQDSVAAKRQYVSSLAEEVATQLASHPVYYLLVDGSGTFPATALPPRPGLLAWLQHTHMISICHGQTIYIWSTAEHRSSAEACGLLSFKSDRLAAKPQSLVAVKFSRPEAPPFLQSQRLLPPHGLSHSASVERERSEATIPLYAEACALAGETSVSVKIGRGVWHGMAWSGMPSLSIYQSQWRQTLTAVQPLGADESAWLVQSSRSPMRRTISLRRQTSFRTAAPIQTTSSRTASAASRAPEPRRQPAKAAAIAPGFLPPESLFVDTQAVDTLPMPAASSIDDSLDVVTALDISQLAAGARVFSSGSQLLGRVHDLACNTTASSVHVSASVDGSNREKYSVSANVSTDGSVPHYNCSCPFHNRRDHVKGCCKHVVAMLLEFNVKRQLKQQRQRSASKIAEATATTRTVRTAPASCAVPQPAAQNTAPPWVTTMDGVTTATSAVSADEHAAAVQPVQPTADVGGRSLPDWLAGTQMKRQSSLKATSATTTSADKPNTARSSEFVSPVRPTQNRKRGRPVGSAATKQQKQPAAEYHLSEAELLATAKLILRQRTQIKRGRAKTTARHTRQAPSQAITYEKASNEDGAAEREPGSGSDKDDLCVDALLEEVANEDVMKEDESDDGHQADNRYGNDQLATTDDITSDITDNVNNVTATTRGDALDEFFAAVTDMSPEKALHDAPTVVPETIMAEEEAHDQLDLLNMFDNHRGDKRRHVETQPAEKLESVEYPKRRAELALDADIQSTAAVRLRRTSTDQFLHDGRSSSSGIGSLGVGGGRRQRRPGNGRAARITGTAAVVPESFAVLPDDSETQLM